jgi:hypothetical protein
MDEMPGMSFEIIGDIGNVETIAIGNSIREVRRLRRTYGKGPRHRAERNKT